MDASTFSDIFRNSFLEEFSQIPLTTSLAALASACVLGLFIFFIYRKTFTGVMYSRPFNMSLVLLTLLTTLVILAVTSNVVLSLGMVGALSIVRFRTAIKDPLDLVFLFWSLAAGIILGAGMFLLAYFGSILIGTVFLIFVRRHNPPRSYILMLDTEAESAEADAYRLLKSRFPRLTLKSKTVSPGQTELLYELELESAETGFVDELHAIPGIRNAALVSRSDTISV